MWLAAGSVPELGEDGRITTPRWSSTPAALVAWHRKAHLYPPTLEPSVFTPGDRLTTFDDPALGRVGLVVSFDGDFPEVARTLALRGARLVLAPAAYEVEGANAWDLLYPALALTNSQWWVQANQAGSHSTSTLLGASRIVAPTGTVVAEASRAVPGALSRAELLVHRIDLHIAHAREESPAFWRTSATPTSTSTGCRRSRPEQLRSVRHRVSLGAAPRGHDVVAEDDVMLVGQPRQVRQPGDQVRRRTPLPPANLRRVRSTSTPATGSSNGSPDGPVRIVDLRLEQFASEQVVDDHAVTAD